MRPSLENMIFGTSLLCSEAINLKADCSLWLLLSAAAAYRSLEFHFTDEVHVKMAQCSRKQLLLYLWCPFCNHRTPQSYTC